MKLVSTVAVNDSQLGLYRVAGEQLPTNEVTLTDEAGNKGRRRFVVEVVRGVPLLQLAVFQHADVIAHGKGLGLIMGHQHGTDTAGLENVAHFSRESAAQFTIEIGEGFIQQQQTRVGSHGPSQRNALLLTAGQLMRIA